MANIIEFSKSTSYVSRNGNVVNVNCIYEKGCLPDGTPCVILKTYNPSSRNAGISQTLHLTRETSLELIKILTKELNL